jgi:transcription elongation factor SPT6
VSALAEEWNDYRREVLKKALEGGLLKEGESHVRGALKEEAEELVAAECRRTLESVRYFYSPLSLLALDRVLTLSRRRRQRVEAAPWCRADGTMENGQTPSVLALSNGNGDPKRDNIVAVFLDQDGHFREHLILDRLSAEEGMIDSQREAFTELLRRRRPQVVVVGGFRPATVQLMDDFRRFASDVSNAIVKDEMENEDEDDIDEDERRLPYEERMSKRHDRAAFESTYVYDDVARIYQNSPRAAQEFTELSTLGKYCVGLARYIQSPLNEYAALGADLSALNYASNQKYVRFPFLSLSLLRLPSPY